MMNSKNAKLIAVILSAVLLICATVAIAAMADSAESGPVLTTDKLGIASLNISYKAQTEVAFAVYDGLDAPAEGVTREIYLLFFNSDPDADGEKNGYQLYRSAVARKTSAGNVTVNGVECLLFYSNGIKAKDIANDMFACPVIVEKGAGETTYTRGYTRKVVSEGEEAVYTYTARECNMLAYAQQKVLETLATLESLDAQLAQDGLTEQEIKNLKVQRELVANEISLYGNIVGLARAVSNKAGEKFAATLIIDGGVIIGSGADGAGYLQMDVSDYADDAKISLRAEAKNPDGKYFLYWQDVYGKVVSTNRIYVDAPVHNNIGYSKYVAVYGDKIDSFYANVYDFESMNDGIIVGPYQTNSSTATSNDSTARTPYVKDTAGEKLTVNDLTYWNRTYVNSDTKEYIADTVLEILNNNGDKSFHIAKDAVYYAPVQTYTVTENTPNRVNLNAVEVDIKLDKNTDLNDYMFKVALVANAGGAKAYDVSAVVGIKGNDADGYEIRVGGYYNSTVYYNPDLTNPAEEGIKSTDTSDARYANVATYKIKSLDEMFTLKFIVDDSGSYPIASAYINEKLMFIGSGIKTATNLPYGYFTKVEAGYTPNANVIEKTTFLFNRTIAGGATLDNLMLFEY